MNPEKLTEILSQPFIYLTEGLQSFIYKSRDGAYILKTFKNLQQSKDQFKAWGLNPDDITIDLVENSLNSYQLAFDKLKDETALVYIHISNESLLDLKIILDNKEYASSEIQFILQEKVELVRDRMKRMKGSGNVDEIRNILEEIMNFIGRMWEKGITEDTFNWDHNYGYTVSGKLVQIDVGTFWEGDKFIKEEIQAKKLLDSVSSKWLNDNFPELTDFYTAKARHLYARFVS